MSPLRLILAPTPFHPHGSASLVAPTQPAARCAVVRLWQWCESLEAREEERAKMYEEVPQEITDLKAETQQLQDLLEKLRPSKPEKGK